VRTAQENARQQEALAAKAKERFDEAKREAEQLREEAQRLRRELAAKQLELETISEEHRQHKAALETRDMLARLIRNLIAECNSVHRMRFTPQQIEMFDDNSYQHIDNAIRVLQETVTLLSSYTQHHYIDGEVING
jgi:regulator of replication initiation timing